MDMNYYPTPKCPDSTLRRMYICLFVRFTKWRMARAASKLAEYSWMRGDVRTWEAADSISNKLWAEVFEEENK